MQDGFINKNPLNDLLSGVSLHDATLIIQVLPHRDGLPPSVSSSQLEYNAPKNFLRNISLAGLGSELKAAHTHTHHLLHNTVCFIAADLLYFCCCQCTSLRWVSIFTLLFLLSTFLWLVSSLAGAEWSQKYSLVSFFHWIDHVLFASYYCYWKLIVQ